MKNTSNPIAGQLRPVAGDPSAIFAALAVALAPFLRTESSDLVTHTDLPKPLRRPFLEAVRAGELVGSKEGRVVVVQRKDFDGWLAAHRVQARKLAANDTTAPAGNTEADVDALAARLGFRVAG